MEHINNDMDDLFQKAGKLYPLKTSESDWDGVLGKLKEDGVGDQTAVSGLADKGKRNKRRWIFLLLLLPLGLGSLIYFSPFKKQQFAAPVPATLKSNQITGTDAAENKPAILSHEAITSANNNNKEVLTHSKEIDPSENNTQEQSTYKASGDSRSKNDGLSKKRDIPSGTGDMSNANNAIAEIPPFNPEPFHEAVAKPISLSVYGPNEIVSIYGMPFSTGSAASVSLKAQISESIVKSKPINAQSTKGIYVGFLVGPDLSTVDFQSIKQPGFSLGVLAGYRFNKRLSIETGLMWDKKYYYSNGDHIDKSTIGIPWNEKVLSVNGNCNMFEIPIDLRYDFANGKNHGFFAKAGLSSYLMKKEYYNYEAAPYGGPSWSGDSTYYNATNNIFSIIQLSAGYEHEIGRNTKIRIEPYLKIPLQGIGIGNMPISSAGFYLGISHSFH